jgi:hypothetical protein
LAACAEGLIRAACLEIPCGSSARQRARRRPDLAHGVQAQRRRVKDGPWRTSLTTGSGESGPYRRAFVALHGLFALDRSETVYYTAGTDSDGRPLDGDCRYVISGRDPEARWWSITAYGADDYLIANPEHRYSVSKSSLVRGAGGGFVVALGGAAAANNWIALAPGRFSLTLRLYNPGPSVLLHPGDAALPRVNRVACS